MPQPPARAPRGRPKRVTRDEIVAAARDLPLSELTMQAVADRLDVDRTTLRYHVTNRDILVGLVAAELLTAELDGATLSGGSDWREILDSYAHIARDALRELGEYATHVPATIMVSTPALLLVEDVLMSLADAGFDDATSRHVLFAVTQFAAVSARDEAFGPGAHPQRAALDTALADSALGEGSAVRRLAQEWDVTVEEAFEVGLAAMLVGFDALRGRQAQQPSGA